MFVLNGPSQQWRLLVNTDYTIGRSQNCHIRMHIQGNLYSMSRHHATVRVSSEQPKPKSTSASTSTSPTASTEPDGLYLWISDHSKYGTYVEGKRIGQNESEWARVSVGQSIYLGPPHSAENNNLQSDATASTANNDSIRLTLSRLPLCVSYSRLDSAMCEEALKMVQHLGGIMAKIWTPTCTHLIIRADNTVVSEKIILSIIYGIPLVPLDWVRAAELLAAPTQVNSQKSLLPDYRPFIPKMDWPEHIYDANGSIINRRHLFMDKTFIFISERCHQHCRGMLEAAGGTVHLFPATLTEKMLSSLQSWIVVEPQDDNKKPIKAFKMVKKLAEKLTGISYQGDYGPGVCKEADLGGAILYGSRINFVETIDAPESPPLSPALLSTTKSATEPKSNPMMATAVFTASLFGNEASNKRKHPSESVNGNKLLLATLPSPEEVDFGPIKKKRNVQATENIVVKSSRVSDSVNNRGIPVPLSQGLQLDFPPSESKRKEKPIKIKESKKRSRRDEDMDWDEIDQVKTTSTTKRFHAQQGLFDGYGYGPAKGPIITAVISLDKIPPSSTRKSASYNITPGTLPKSEILVPFNDIHARKQVKAKALESSLALSSSSVDPKPEPPSSNSTVELFEKLTIDLNSMPRPRCPAPNSSQYGVNYKTFRKAQVL